MSQQPQYERRVLALLETIAAELQAIRHAVDRQGSRDAADADVVTAIAAAVKGASFNVAELLRHASQVDGDLQVALRHADMTSAMEVGCLLRRLEGHRIGDVRIKRHGRDRRGIVWKCM